jgi:hypothetical protein
MECLGVGGNAALGIGWRRLIAGCLVAWMRRTGDWAEGLPGRQAPWAAVGGALAWPCGVSSAVG